jgi:predicted AAA+ superfamily ATPase
VSLAGLLAGGPVEPEESAIDFRATVSRIVTGGWPGWWQAAEPDALANAGSYIADIVERDFPAVAGPRRDPRRLLALLRALAGLEAHPATEAAVTRRMSADDGTRVAGATARSLIDLASRLYLLADQGAWAAKLRSASALARLPKRHLADPSLAAALLGATSDRLLAEPDTLGHLFESQVVHDLAVYARSHAWRGVFHLRDTKGRDEIDAVVEADDGRWIGIEAKLGEGGVDAGAANLLRVAAKVAHPPAALAIVTPVGIAHRRPDGVIVLPLTVLGP